MSEPVIGIQLYTVRNLLAEDAEGTLRSLAAMGYEGVQHSGGAQVLPASLMQRVTEETGLVMVGTHAQLPALETALDEEVDYCRALNCRHVAIAWTSPEEHADVPRLAERINTVGHRLHDQGITLSYHNHGAEFAPLDDSTVLDVLLAETDPEWLKLELDVAWAAVANADPVACLRRYAGRIPFLHVKDLNDDGSFADVGEGILPMEEICRAALDGGTEYFIVEHDAPADPMETARRSLENLQGILASIQ
jgi:sugar phosphate isomerase/epimerase